MKRLVLTLAICLGCLGILEAQNVWKPISSNSPILGAASNGDLYAMGGYSGLLRSQDEGETWQVVLGYETGFKLYWAMKLVSVVTSTSIALRLALKEESVSLMITSRL